MKHENNESPVKYILDFFRDQLETWELARNNYSYLAQAQRKTFSCGDLLGYVQCNPKRAVSTHAKVDKASILKRKCFLCKPNRPVEQTGLEIMEGWELLVNPYPILNPHFTIASRNHTIQKLEIEAGIRLAKLLPGFVVFYNDSGAGASAPDHCHYQAVLKNELPLINLLDKEWKFNNTDSLKNLNLPFNLFCKDFSLDKGSSSDMKEYEKFLLPETIQNPVNAFFWCLDSGDIRCVIIPRKAHRPDLFFFPPPARRAISPGAIDMAGILVTPEIEDFEKINEEEIYSIYRQVGIQ